MKALVFTSAYPNNIWPNNGVFVKERMTEFARLDECTVKVVAPVPYFPPFRISRRWLFSQVAPEEIIEGIQVYHPRYFMTPKIGMTLYGLEMFLCVFSFVKKIQKEFDFDLISAHTAYPEGLAGVLLGAVLNKPVIISARGSDINLLQKLPLIRRLLRFTLTKADNVIAVCEDLKRAITWLGIPDKKITVIPNGVDLKKFHPIPKEEARQKLALPNRRMILSVGNLTPNKGFHLLIQALQILFDEFRERDVQLVIVGEGTYRSQLAKTISSLKLNGQVQMVGPVAHDQLHLWYSAADVFCLASEREGWPNVLLESLACGTPVVATSVGGIPEIIRSAKVGLLTERDEAKIAAAISVALKRGWRSEELIEYARNHTWDRTALAVRGVFESALSRKATQRVLDRTSPI